MLEKMAEFFDKRLMTYDEHMLNEIEGAKEFYPFTAECLPKSDHTKLLDLGCGTGLELGYFFSRCPDAVVTCIDLAPGMLDELQRKFRNKNITIVNGSYFDIPFTKNYYDAAVSVESLHHFTKEEKIPLYRKIFISLQDDGFFILTDYFASTDEDEKHFRNELIRLKEENSISDKEFYHYDTPLTVGHETEALKEAGFTKVEVLKNWANTYTIKASK